MIDTGDAHDLHGAEPPSPAAAGRLYDALYTSSPFEDAPRFYQWILRLARPSPGDAVLDIGCGLGGALGAIEQHGTEYGTQHGVQAWGLDVSREAARRARTRFPAARVVVADGARLPFPDATFAVVLNLGNLEHFTDLEAGVREMRRVLRPDGRAWVLLPNLYYSGTLWQVIRKGYGPDHHQPIDRFATRQEWRDVLEAGGLEVVRSLPYHKGKWWKRLLPANLAWHFLYETRVGPSRAGALPPLGRVRSPLGRERDEA